MHRSVHSSNIYSNSQDMDAAWMSIDRGMYKEDVVQIHNGVLLSHKKDEIVPFATTQIDLEYIMLSELNQTRENQMLYDITYTWNLKNKRN